MIKVTASTGTKEKKIGDGSMVSARSATSATELGIMPGNVQMQKERAKEREIRENVKEKAKGTTWGKDNMDLQVKEKRKAAKDLGK